MAKPAQELQKFPIPYIYPDTKRCQCGLSLTKGLHECMESGVLEGRFCDIVCLVKADGAKWNGGNIVDYLGNTYSEEEYLEVMEAG